MIRIVSYPDDLKDIRNSDNLYRFDLKGDEFPYNAFDYYVDMKIVAYGTGENRTILKDNKEYLQQRMDKVIELLEMYALYNSDGYSGFYKIKEGIQSKHINYDDFKKQIEDILRGKADERKN